MKADRESARQPARYVALLLDFLETIGVERRELLQQARLRSIEAATAEVTLAQVEALLAAAEKASGRSDLGFELGRRLDPTAHDVLGFAMITSPTLGHMLRLAVTYQRLIQPFFALTLLRSSGRADLVYVPDVALTGRAMRFFEEAIVVSNYSGLRSALGAGIPPFDVWMSIEPPPHADRYRDLRPARIRFAEGPPGLRISLPEAVLDTPLALANPRAMRAAEQRCKAMLGRKRSRRRWSDWCRLMVRESEDSRPTLEQLAGFMNIAPRTLARYLEAEGTRFRDLSLEVRTERARQMLEEGELSVTQIAYRLGFADVASFVRSFHAQTGCTPGLLRQSAASRRR